LSVRIAPGRPIRERITGAQIVVRSDLHVSKYRLSRRCRETRDLELHHLKPFAHGGENVASNLTLRCSAHNALAAEEDFGREVIEQKRDSTRHESLAAQSRHRRDTAG
jgi:hypothetical protein